MATPAGSQAGYVESGTAAGNLGPERSGGAGKAGRFGCAYAGRTGGAHHYWRGDSELMNSAKNRMFARNRRHGLLFGLMILIALCSTVAAKNKRQQAQVIG